MEVDPCKVCGAKDVNLVDGFYYCVECGTQDVNVRETIVEQTALGDGTFAIAAGRKFTTVVQDGIEMSSEWHKWHTFNFMLAGLTDELISLGAKPSLKMKVLWVWTRYIKKFQVKEDLELTAHSEIDIADETIKSIGNIEDDISSNSEDTDDEIDLNNSKRKKKKKKPPTEDKFLKDIKIVTKGTLLSILYVALNLDRSDIQLSHLFRFIREGRLSIYNCMKYVPKELDIKAIKNWKSFVLCQKEYTPKAIRALAMTCFKRLDLGLPLVPDLRKIVKNYMKELCLPNDVTDLVFSLMHYIPTNFLDIDHESIKLLTRIPDYEGVCMSYVVVALKMCFGLDCDYEVRLSDEVDKINDKENYLKSHKLGMFPEPTNRLFSFNSWCQHLQFRKIILGKNYLPMARQFKSATDDYVFMEHLHERSKRDIRLSDDVTMDILNKIEIEVESKIIPKVEFPATLTPISTYIDIVAQYEQDPDVRLLLSEDFTQYSLKYALRDFGLPYYSENEKHVLTGIADTGKSFNICIMGTLKRNEGDMNMVYVRNCENKNWIKTKPPTIDHVTKTLEPENASDKESDHGYDSNVESTITESDKTHISIHDETCQNNFEDKKLEFIEEQDGNIFDDDFKDIAVAPRSGNGVTIKQEDNNNIFEFYNQSIDNNDVMAAPDNTSYDGESMSLQFDPNTFNKQKMIEELVQLAREKYKIPVLKEKERKEERVPKKRKVDSVNTEAAPSEPKKKRDDSRLKPGEFKQAVDHLVSTYYTNIQNDVLNKISEQVRSVIENQNAEPPLEETDIPNFNSPSNMNIDENESQIGANMDEIGADENISQVEISSRLEPDNTTVDESVQEEHTDDLICKSDPKFDENTHDIKQLYVKLGDEMNMDDLFEFDDDSELTQILDKQIELFSNYPRNRRGMLKNIELNGFNDDKHNTKEDNCDANSELLEDRRLIEEEKKARRKEKLVPLISDPSKIPSYKYWFRHYKSQFLNKSQDMCQVFDLEMNKNLPTSFVFVIRECAAVLGCTMFSLYKNMQNIEQLMIIANNIGDID